MDGNRHTMSVIPIAGPHHQPWNLTAAEREVYRVRSRESRRAKAAALAGVGPAPLHPIYAPRLDPLLLMPELPRSGIRALSLFSGGGGLDLGFSRAGFEHAGSFEILEDAAATLTKANPNWDVFGGEDGDVTAVDWRRWKGRVDVIHGGPPCQPFSSAGRQRGPQDSRDMFPEFVRAVLEIRPTVFVAENVPALGSAKFADYVTKVIVDPLSERYTIMRIELRGEHFGVPQVRRRLMFVGFRSRRAASRFVPPEPTHVFGGGDELARTMGAREALGLPDTGYDALAPTIRSGLTGPRHTTSVLNSVSARRTWERLGIWPNGVAATREAARLFLASNGHYRMSVADVALLQCFPESWPFQGAVYMALGQIGNAVPPPLGYSIASAVRASLA